MFPDSKIAAKFSVMETKCTVHVIHEIQTGTTFQEDVSEQSQS